METYSHLTEQRTEEQLTLFAEAFPASPSQPQESEKVLRMNDISFQKCFGLFERSNRVSWWLKTFAGFLVSNLDGYLPRLSHHWKAKVSRSSLFVFLLQPSARRTDATGSGLLGTPRAQMGGRTTDTGRMQLEEQIATAMLPTPTTRDDRAGCNQKTLYKEIAMLPTPRTSDMQQESAVRVGKLQRGEETIHQLRERVAASGTQTGSTLRLEPAFVEWMQGYPLNWTSLEAENEDWPEMGAGTDAEILPTPTTQEVEQLLPTPQARDYKPPDQPHQANYKRKVEKGYTIDLNSIIANLGQETTETPD